MNEQRNPSSEIIDEAAFEAARAAGGPPLMPRHGPKKPRSRLPDALALSFCVSVLVAVFYPVWAGTHRDNRTRGIVLNENKQPMTGAVLRVRDAEGRDLGAATTDTNGEVFWKREWREPGTTFGGYGVTRYSHATGGRDHVYLSPLVPHQVRVKNAVTGLVQPGLDLKTYPDHETFSPPSFLDEWPMVQTNDKGEAKMGAFPSTARLSFTSADKHFIVWNVLSKNHTYNVAPYQKIVQYDVTVISTGAISGRVVYPDGKPATGGSVSVRLINPAPEPGRLREWNRYTRQNGTFHFDGLVPGGYHVSYANISGYSDVSNSVGSCDVLVLSGQTTTVDPPLSVNRPADLP